MNAATAVLAAESLSRNRPISNPRFRPRKRMALNFRFSRPRNAIFGIKAAGLRWTKRAKKRFDSVDLSDHMRPDLMFSTNFVRHSAHNKAVWQLKQALLVQI